MRRTPLVAAAVAIALVGGCTPSHPISLPDLPTPAPATLPSGSPAPTAPAGPTDGSSTPIADPIYPQYGNPGLDVLRYGLDLTWAPATKTLTGVADVKLRAVKDLAEVRLDFSSAYRLGGVTVDGAARTAKVSGSKLVVDAPLKAGAAATVVVRYTGTPDTVPMPSHRADVEELGLTITSEGGLWTMQEPFGAFTWYPVNDQPSDKALYDIAITVPAGWSGIASGTPKGQQGNTFRYASSVPVASYLTTLVVGKYRKETATGPHGIPLTYWYRPGVDEDVLPALRKGSAHLAWLEERFGPYPFDTAGVVLVASTSGMETQQMITMGASRSDRIDGDLLHEYAHQWFGDAVTTSNWRDLWLNEGWAMYVQYLYMNERDGISMSSWERQIRLVDTDLRERAGPPGKPDPGRFAESNVYICPALMLHQIHKKIGDQRFFALARDWVQQHRNTAQDRAAFIAFVNKHTGEDFTTLINTWLDSPTTPKIS
ncbi:aminopeptidase N [Allocatelliglobosispora scoriae]|uniref:Aminopeptidase N n=1 Tax=Allocatelliglobosispora scoriae TaxID=643052 RepID=A0A841C0L4_9ACTN|nr:M1 family metallopeptidase [Allocatelliglobosispora scoriae]MBB5872889.1 aminopeptidase N [Allocatelliglobosispora scoriae]